MSCCMAAIASIECRWCSFKTSKYSFSFWITALDYMIESNWWWIIAIHECPCNHCVPKEIRSIFFINSFSSSVNGWSSDRINPTLSEWCNLGSNSAPFASKTYILVELLSHSVIVCWIDPPECHKPEWISLCTPIGTTGILSTLFRCPQIARSSGCTPLIFLPTKPIRLTGPGPVSYTNLTLPTKRIV